MALSFPAASIALEHEEHRPAILGVELLLQRHQPFERSLELADAFRLCLNGPVSSVA